MIQMKREQPAQVAVNVIVLDVRANAGKFRFVRWIAGLLRALRAPRTRRHECEIRRYRHLTCYSDVHPGRIRLGRSRIA